MKLGRKEYDSAIGDRQFYRLAKRDRELQLLKESLEKACQSSTKPTD